MDIKTKREKILEILGEDNAIKVACGIRRKGKIRKEGDFFEIGMARMHGFIEEESLKLTDNG